MCKCLSFVVLRPDPTQIVHIECEADYLLFYAQPNFCCLGAWITEVSDT